MLSFVFLLLILEAVAAIWAPSAIVTMGIFGRNYMQMCMPEWPEWVPYVQGGKEYYDYPPGQKGFARLLGEKAFFGSINSVSLRNGELAPKKSGYRILALGDSFTFGDTDPTKTTPIPPK